MAKGSDTATQSTEPWSAQKPYLEQGFKGAQDWYQSSNPQWYPGATTIPYAPQTQQALGMQEQQALAGQPLIQGAQDATQQMMGGGTNPYLDQMYNQAAGNLATNFRQNVNPQIQAMAESWGGSPMNPSAMQALQAAQKSQYTDPMVSLATQMYGGQYNADQNRRLQAAGMAPEMYQAGFAPAQQLGQVGAAYESKALENLQAEMAKWQFGQNQPLDKLQQYMGLISGNYGGTTTGPNPYASNPYGNVASAAGGLGGLAMMAMGMPGMPMGGAKG